MDAVESQLRGSHETCVWVMGGGEVYETMLPFCRDAVLTMNTREYQADTWFPNLQEMGWPIASEPVEWEEWLKTCVFTNPDPRPFGEMAWKA